eukprot:TRINITY_DN9024_c0_g2_i1.p1 TRINITY_DN9024_c0_g2~~TRINITY_DN9024_c0_g2_i1.p1  ORF type:complete len:613 (-),score=51.70 TRINITY_DN9024_c0_g2_i1:184-2022(-)
MLMAAGASGVGQSSVPAPFAGYAPPPSVPTLHLSTTPRLSLRCADAAAIVSPVQTPRQGGGSSVVCGGGGGGHSFTEGSSVVTGASVAVTSIGPLSYSNGAGGPFAASPINSPMQELGQWRPMLATRRSQSPLGGTPRTSRTTSPVPAHTRYRPRGGQPEVATIASGTRSIGLQGVCVTPPTVLTQPLHVGRSSLRGVAGTTDPGSNSDLRSALASQVARVEEVERQLEGALAVAEGSVPLNRLHETKALYEALLAERDSRLQSQGHLIEELRRVIEEQNSELAKLRSSAASNSTPLTNSHQLSALAAGGSSTSQAPDLRWPASTASRPPLLNTSGLLMHGSAEATSADDAAAAALCDSDRAASSPQAIPPISPWPPVQDSRPVAAALRSTSGSPTSSPKAAARTSGTGSGVGAVNSALSFLASARNPGTTPREHAPLSSRSLTSEMVKSLPTESTALASADTSSVPSAWGASDLCRVGDDPIDRQIRRYFMEHREFKVFTNKLQPGWYTFGKPVQLKVYMKMAAGEVVVRTNRTFKRLERWLDEFRLQSEEDAQISEQQGDGDAVASSSSVARDDEDFEAARRTFDKVYATRSGSPRPRDNPGGSGPSPRS